MEKLRIIGGESLQGEINCSGSKNAALPIIAASILSDKKIIIENLPYLQDITTMFELMGSMGAEIILDETMNFSISTANLNNFEARYELVKTMRASILVLGALLGKYGTAKIALPGGCAIGTRPVNYHLDGLRKLGADIEIRNGYIHASCKRLIGTNLEFEGMTVTGTENLIMAATLAEGTTRLKNVAKEPEIIDLANFLNILGANIKGAGTDEIIVEGVDELSGGRFSIPFDRIEAGTYLAAAVATNGNIKINKIDSSRMGNMIEKFQLIGAFVELNENTIHIKMEKNIEPVDVITEPFPGFPTDMQAQFMTLNCISDGSSLTTETVFENRFQHVTELKKMGAKISLNNNQAKIEGVSNLVGSNVSASDLRASASLVLAGLVGKNRTQIDDIYHIDRGYECIEEKLNKLGAEIIREPTI